MTTYTSDQILAFDDLYALQECDRFEYQLTADEIQWLYFVDDKYSIADFIYNNLSDDILIFDDSWAMSKALDDDNGNSGRKAACLSEDTALAKLFFWLYDEGHSLN